jgi:Tol biopolymer transport system component
MVRKLANRDRGGRGLKKTPLGLLAFGAMCLTTSVLAACGGTPAPSPSPPHTRTLQPGTDFELPAPVYFLRGGQIWRLAADGQTQQQITRETAAVESFDVSPGDAALVYVAGNALVHTDALGEDRQVLLSGPALPPVADKLAALNNRERISGKIGTALWSPAGDRIAYTQNGLQVMALPSGEVQTAHPNGYIPEQGEATDRLVIASVISWSPDGQHLLVVFYSYRLDSIYHQKVGLKTLSGSLSTVGDCVSCTFGWQPDSQVFYLANPSFGGSEALSRCTVADGRCTWIGQDVPARTAFFYGYPHAPNSDEVYVFTGTSPDRGQPPEAFRLYRVGSNGGGIIELRKDEQTIQTALWARDHRGALAVTASAADDIPAGSLVWLPVDGSATIRLPVAGSQMLRWGAGP